MNERFVLLGLLAILGAGWGITQPLAKIAVSEGYRHFGLVFWQQVLSGTILGIVVLLRGRPVRLGRQQLGFCLFIAVIGTVIPSSTSYEAARHLPAGVISILLSLVPMFAFPVAILLSVDRFTWPRFLGLLAGLAGVMLIVGPEASLPERAMVAAIPIALVAPILYAVEGNVVARWGTAGLDPVALLFGASVIGAVLCAPLAIASGQFIDPRPPWGAPDAALALSSVVHAAVYSTYVWLVGRAGAVFAAQASYLVTGFGVLWAMALLGESYSGWVWAAMLLMFAGLFLVQPRPSTAIAALPAKPQDAP